MSNNVTTVVCGFPGVGKSHLSKQCRWHDSDSSKFSWLEPKVRNPAFPANYTDHIRSLSGVVLASSHLNVRDALFEAGIPFWLLYPTPDCKAEYLERYRRRGSPESFLELLDKNWDDWILGMDTEVRDAGRFLLRPGFYAADVSGSISAVHNWRLRWATSPKPSAP